MNNINVTICGIGCLCSLGNNPDKVWETLTGKEADVLYDAKYEFTTTIPAKTKRKADRFSLIGMYTVSEAYLSMEETVNKEPCERIGTIFSSIYGPLTTNIAFTKEYLNYEPDECSPLKFSNTVANACLGHICMYYKLKGVSTMLMGSNALACSLDLFKQDKADYIFAGYIEEYNEDIFNALKQVKGLEEKKFAENAVTFLLSNHEETQNTYCRIVALKEVNLKRNTLVYPNEDTKDDYLLISRCIKGCIEDIDLSRIDCVVVSSHENMIDQTEMKVIDEILPSIPVVNRIKDLAGETLGSSLNVNLLIASLCLKHGYVPERISGYTGEIKLNNMILVTGYDIAGNYTCVLLEK